MWLEVMKHKALEKEWLFFASIRSRHPGYIEGRCLADQTDSLQSGGQCNQVYRSRLCENFYKVPWKKRTEILPFQ